MTRVKETPPGSGEMPEYKSPPSRINASLRKGYDNLRVRLQKKSMKLDDMRGSKRDIEKSREKWKAESKEKETQISNMQKRIDLLEAQLKKK